VQRWLANVGGVGGLDMFSGGAMAFVPRLSNNESQQGMGMQVHTAKNARQTLFLS